MNLPRITQSQDLLPSGQLGTEGAARASFGKLLILSIYFLTIVLDFRRLEGDENPFVMVMGIANVLLGAWYCVVYRYFTPLLFWWISAFVLLACFGTFTGILYGQGTYLVFSHAVPIFSFLFAAIAVHSISGDAEKKNVISIVLATSFIAAVVGNSYWAFTIMTSILVP